MTLRLLEMDHRVRSVLSELGGVGSRQAQHVAGEFNGGDLHTQAQAQVGDPCLAGVAGGPDLAFDAPVTKSAGNQNAAEVLELLGRIIAFEVLGLDLDDLYPGIGGDARVLEGFVDRFVGVLKFDVLADHTDAHPVLGGDQAADDVLPVGHVGRRQIQLQRLADQVVHILALQHQRHLVDGVVDVLLLDHCFERDIAEHRQLAANFLAER